jgi:hypothetical protein
MMNRAGAVEEDEMAFSPENQDWVRNEIHTTLTQGTQGYKTPQWIQKSAFPFARVWHFGCQFHHHSNLGCFCSDSVECRE